MTARRLAPLLVPALLLLAQAGPARGAATVIDNRKTAPDALAVPVERFELPNGLVVLLSRPRAL